MKDPELFGTIFSMFLLWKLGTFFGTPEVLFMLFRSNHGIMVVVPHAIWQVLIGDCEAAIEAMRVRSELLLPGRYFADQKT